MEQKGLDSFSFCLIYAHICGCYVEIVINAHLTGFYATYMRTKLLDLYVRIWWLEDQQI